MNKRIISILCIIMVTILILIGCTNNKIQENKIQENNESKDNTVKYEVGLFNDIYYPLVSNNEIVNEGQIRGYLSKYDSYEIEHDIKNNLYNIMNKNSNDESYVYINIKHNSNLISSIGYYDAKKDIGVIKRYNHNVGIKDIYKTYISGNAAEEVSSVYDQIKFLRDTFNEHNNRDDIVKYEVDLFNDIYYPIASNNEILNEHQIKKYLSKNDRYNDRYEVEYDSKTNSYNVTDKNTNDKSYVYINIKYNSDLINSISYYDSQKNIEVNKIYNHNVGIKDIYKTHILGNAAEEVSSVYDQIKFLRDTVNEDYQKTKDNDNSEEPIELKFDLSYKIINGRLQPLLKTNLPNNTSGSFHLTSLDNDYKASSSYKIQEGQSTFSEFTNKGNKLLKGKYTLKATLPLSMVQDKEVQFIVGIDYSNYKGDEIKEDNTGIYVEKKIDVLLD